MAQFIDPTNTELAKFPTWRAHTGRQVAREISGIRGCAPAIHFHDTANDTSTSLFADDDRIFTVYTGDRVHVWGQEMWVNNTLGRFCQYRTGFFKYLLSTARKYKRL